MWGEGFGGRWFGHAVRRSRIPDDRPLIHFKNNP